MRREGFLSLRPALIVSFDSRKEGAHRLHPDEEVTREETPKLSKTDGFLSCLVVVVSDPQSNALSAKRKGEKKNKTRRDSETVHTQVGHKFPFSIRFGNI
jgi:hypothetical protein